MTVELSALPGEAEPWKVERIWSKETIIALSM